MPQACDILIDKTNVSLVKEIFFELNLIVMERGGILFQLSLIFCVKRGMANLGRKPHFHDPSISHLWVQETKGSSKND